MDTIVLPFSTSKNPVPKCLVLASVGVNASRCHSNGVHSAKYLQSGSGALNRPSSYCVKEISYMYHFNFFLFCWTLEEPSKQTEFFKY